MLQTLKKQQQQKKNNKQKKNKKKQKTKKKKQKKKKKTTKKKKKKKKKNEQNKNALKCFNNAEFSTVNNSAETGTTTRHLHDVGFLTCQSLSLNMKISRK